MAVVCGVDAVAGSGHSVFPRVCAVLGSRHGTALLRRVIAVLSDIGDLIAEVGLVVPTMADVVASIGGDVASSTGLITALGSPLLTCWGSAFVVVVGHCGAVPARLDCGSRLRHGNMVVTVVAHPRVTGGAAQQLW